jgi:hypothetical protein
MAERNDAKKSGDKPDRPSRRLPGMDSYQSRYLALATVLILALLGLLPGAMAVKHAIAGNIADAIPLTLMTHALVGVALVVGLAWG